MTHLYSYFGILLGCSQVGQTGFSAYAGQTSMYTTHKFMALDAYEVGYFIQQVGLAAKSFGVANEDIEAVAYALNNLFGYRCADKVHIVPKAAEELQSICIAVSRTVRTTRSFALTSRSLIACWRPTTPALLTLQSSRRSMPTDLSRSVERQRLQPLIRVR